MVRYVHLPAAAVDTALLEDATRRGESYPPVVDLRMGAYANECTLNIEAEQQASKPR